MFPWPNITFHSLWTFVWQGTQFETCVFCVKERTLRPSKGKSVLGFLSASTTKVQLVIFVHRDSDAAGLLLPRVVSLTHWGLFKSAVQTPSKAQKNLFDLTEGQWQLVNNFLCRLGSEWESEEKLSFLLETTVDWRNKSRRELNLLIGPRNLRHEKIY